MTNINELFKYSYLTDWIDSNNTRQCLYLLSKIYLVHMRAREVIVDHTIDSERLKSKLTATFKPMYDPPIDYEINFKQDIILAFEHYPRHSMQETFITSSHVINPKEIVDKNEIYNGIIRFIKSKTCIEIKESIVGQLKNSWRNVEKGIDYTWIIDNKDDEFTKWIINYFKKSKLDPWFLPYELDRDIAHYSIITILDLWDPKDIIPNFMSKHQFIEKLKKASVQKKHRMKLKNKKVYTFEMHTDIGRKLDRLANLLEIKKNHLLEELINNKYESISRFKK
ncbi:TPA: hypothetical protein ACGF83_003407, partial [Vibrio cholerae]